MSLELVRTSLARLPAPLYDERTPPWSQRPGIGPAPGGGCGTRSSGGQSFALYPLQAGVLKRDSGLSTENHYLGRSFKRQGQQVSTVNLTYTLSGKQGNLTIRERNEWVDVSQKNARGFDYRPGVAIGTWKVVSGTGAYAKLAGGGRSAHAGMGKQWFIRLEGYLTSR
jgi:hypothetical protein